MPPGRAVASSVCTAGARRFRRTRCHPRDDLAPPPARREPRRHSVRAHCAPRRGLAADTKLSKMSTTGGGAAIRNGD